MLKWLLALILTVIVSGLLTPWLRRRGWGRMPGDVRLERKGHKFYFPFASVVVLSLVFSLIFHVLLR